MEVMLRNILPFVLLGFYSCSTNDVELVPKAQIQSSATVIPENGGVLQLTITLDVASAQDVQVELSLKDNGRQRGAKPTHGINTNQTKR